MVTEDHARTISGCGAGDGRAHGVGSGRLPGVRGRSPTHERLPAVPRVRVLAVPVSPGTGGREFHRKSVPREDPSMEIEGISSGQETPRREVK